MSAAKEFVVGIAQGAGVALVESNKRVRMEPVGAGLFDLATIVVQAAAYEVTTAGALALYEAGRTGGVPGGTVIVLAPGTWTSVQPSTTERAG